jgi:hypothetical protein
MVMVYTNDGTYYLFLIQKLYFIAILSWLCKFSVLLTNSYTVDSLPDTDLA